MRQVIGIVLVAGSLVLSLSARQAPDSPPVFRASVDLVQIDVSVLDKNRHPVTGLTAADFTVLEDGKARPIASFTPVDLPRRQPAPEAAAAAWTRDVAPDVATNAAPLEGRLVVIMFDWSIRREDQPEARRIATAAVNAMGPGDQAAVLFSNPARTAGTPQNFTADRARLLDAINRPMAAAIKAGPADDIRNVNGAMIDDPEGYESGDCSCRRCVMEDVTQIANLVRDVPGRRKVLLFIGTFFQGFEPVSLTGATPQPPGVSPFRPPPGEFVQPTIISASKTLNLWPGWCAGVLNAARNDMQRATGLANLTIDAVDPAGAPSPGDDPMGGSTQFQMKRLDDLHVMPDITGGRTIVNTNAPDEQIPSLLDESGSYYLIGFERASGVNDGKLHSIDVKVKRQGVDVHTRSGYYASNELAAIRAPETLPIAKSLDRVLPESDIALAAEAAPFASTGGPHASVAVVVNVHDPVPAGPGGGAASSPRPATVTNHVLAALFDAQGRSVASSQESVTLTEREGGPGTYEIFSRLPSDPGRYEVRIAVDAGANHRGTVYTFVDVPDFAKEPISMSGIILHREPAVPAPPADIFSDVLPLAPTATRDFARTDRVTALVNLYEAASVPNASVSVRARIVDVHNRVVFTDASSLEAGRFGASRPAAYQVDLPLSALDAGEYLLTVDATRDATVATGHVRFTVTESPTSSATAPARSGDAATSAQPSRNGGAPRTELGAVLRAVGGYLDNYGRSLSNVVAEETYVQESLGPPVNSRHLRSDLVFMTGAASNWVAFRDVFEADGTPVRGRDDRIAKLFLTDASPDARLQATRIAQESARFNLNIEGVSLNRSINVPISALIFFRTANQSRSTFKIDHVNAVDGRQVADVEFAETATPRLIGSQDNVAMRGRASIDVETGRVLHTDLFYVTKAHLVYPNGAADVETSATIAVAFAENRKLSLWLPLSMDEQYIPTVLTDDRPQPMWLASAASSAVRLPTLTGHATYANFRTFGVDVQTGVN